MKAKIVAGKGGIVEGKTEIIANMAEIRHLRGSKSNKNEEKG